MKRKILMVRLGSSGLLVVGLALLSLVTIVEDGERWRAFVNGSLAWASFVGILCWWIVKMERWKYQVECASGKQERC